MIAAEAYLTKERSRAASRVRTARRRQKHREHGTGERRSRADVERRAQVDRVGDGAENHGCDTARARSRGRSTSPEAKPMCPRQVLLAHHHRHAERADHGRTDHAQRDERRALRRRARRQGSRAGRRRLLAISTGRRPKRSAAGPARSVPIAPTSSMSDSRCAPYALRVAERDLPERHERDQPEPGDAAERDDPRAGASARPAGPRPERLRPAPARRPDRTKAERGRATGASPRRRDTAPSRADRPSRPSATTIGVVTSAPRA